MNVEVARAFRFENTKNPSVATFRLSMQLAKTVILFYFDASHRYKPFRFKNRLYSGIRRKKVPFFFLVGCPIQPVS